MLNASFFNLMGNALMASDLKQQVYANNIANQNTPGFKEQHVQFDELAPLLVTLVMSKGALLFKNTYIFT